MISHLNATLIISTLETEQCAFQEPQFAYIVVTFMFTMHCQDRHMSLFTAPLRFLMYFRQT